MRSEQALQRLAAGTLERLAMDLSRRVTGAALVFLLVEVRAASCSGASSRCIVDCCRRLSERQGCLYCSQTCASANLFSKIRPALLLKWPTSRALRDAELNGLLVLHVVTDKGSVLCYSHCCRLHAAGPHFHDTAGKCFRIDELCQLWHADSVNI